MPTEVGTVEDVAALVTLIREPGRTHPVVVVTTRNRETVPLIDAAALAEAVRPLPVHVLRTGELTWELTALLPDEMGVFGGAARVWWPGYADSDPPRRHPLFFAYSAGEGDAASRRLLADLARHGVAVRHATPTPGSARLARQGEQVTGEVTALVYHGADVRLEDGRAAYVPAPLVADVPPAHPRDLLVVGDRVQGWLTGRLRDGLVELDLRRGLQPAAHVETGTVVEARVLEAMPGGVELDVAPGVRGWYKLPRKAEPPVVGGTLRVRVVKLEGGRAVLETPPRERPPAPVVVGPPAPKPGPPHPARRHTDQDPAPEEAAGSDADLVVALQGALAEARREIAGLKEELDAQRQHVATTERTMAEGIRDLRRQLQESRGETRAARDRSLSLEARLTGSGAHEDPEQQLRHEVQVAWQRYQPDDRRQWPLRGFLLGPEFLVTVASLHGIERSKIVDVCTDVVTGRAAQMASREVHPLRTAEGGDAPQRVRADGAMAWRASLQHNTPSARRLHYWQLRDGRVELARVGVHDDMTIR